MKKVLITIGILTLLVTSAYSQQKRNIYASWVDVSTTVVMIQFPLYPTPIIGDLFIYNGDDANEICIDIYGNDILADCIASSQTNPTVFQLEAGDSLELYNIVTPGISFSSPDGTASPVSIVVSY